MLKYGLKPGKFFIYTGSVYPHKNVARLIKAFLRLEDKELVLAIVCARSIFVKRLEKLVKKLKGSGRVKFLGFVPDEELKALYQRAIALVQPSLMEGFGLTGLEAMACLCPVVSSNTSCLPEVYGKAALYFDPLKVEQITEKLTLVSQNKVLCQRLVKLGKKHAAGFSWQKTAAKTLKIYQKALKSRKEKIKVKSNA